jgi:hypothetical protein
MGEEQRFIKKIPRKFLLLLKYCSKAITIKESLPSKQDAKVRGQKKKSKQVICYPF